MNSKVLLHQASLLNAQGVQALTVGDAAEAHQSFKHALETMSRVMQGVSGQEATVEKCNAWQQNVVSCCPLPGLDNGDFYVCNNALLFAVQQQNEIDSAAIAVCCHAIMFNMALALHQRGMMTSNQRNLASAARLYEQCLRLRAEIHGPAHDANILAMASLNNSAQIYYSLGEYDKALEHLQILRQLVSETDLCEGVSPSLGGILQIDDVILNVLVISKPSTAPCA